MRKLIALFLIIAAAISLNSCVIADDGLYEPTVGVTVYQPYYYGYYYRRNYYAPRYNYHHYHHRPYRRTPDRYVQPPVRSFRR